MRSFSRAALALVLILLGSAQAMQNGEGQHPNLGAGFNLVGGGTNGAPGVGEQQAVDPALMAAVTSNNNVIIHAVTQQLMQLLNPLSNGLNSLHVVSQRGTSTRKSP